jgi:hypothetical protein
MPAFAGMTEWHDPARRHNGLACSTQMSEVLESAFPGCSLTQQKGDLPAAPDRRG